MSDDAAAYNNYFCDGLSSSPIGIENALFNQDFSIFDEAGIVYLDITENWDGTWWGETAEDEAAINALEGQERANEVCRVLYELNSLAQVQEGYCCQGVYFDLMGNNAADGVITSATTVTLSEEVITITAPDTNDYELSYGAVLFNVPETEAEEEEGDEEEGATSAAASLLAIAASLMAYL